MAASIQAVTETVVLKLANTVHSEMGVDYLCLAGGVALNSVANGRLLREGPFKDIWIQPASGDAGGALGVAYSAWHSYLKNTRVPDPGDSMRGSYLGPAYSDTDIRSYLDSVGAHYRQLESEELYGQVAQTPS